MPDTETSEERELYEAARERWVIRERMDGRHVGPSDIQVFRDGWLAGLAFAKSQPTE